MYDLDAIEAINFEQLATATDRLLLLGARRRARPTPPLGIARGSAPALPAKRRSSTLIIRARVVDRRWTRIKHPLLIVFLVALIGAVVWAAATIAGPGAVVISGAVGGLVSGVFAQREVRRARA